MPVSNYPGASILVQVPPRASYGSHLDASCTIYLIVETSNCASHRITHSEESCQIYVSFPALLFYKSDTDSLSQWLTVLFLIILFLELPVTSALSASSGLLLHLSLPAAPDDQVIMDPGHFQNAFPPTSEDYTLLYDSMQEQAAQWPQSVVGVARLIDIDTVDSKKNQSTASPTTSFPFPMQQQTMSDPSSLSTTPPPFQANSYPFSPPSTISPDGHAPPAAAATYIQYRLLAPSELPLDTSEVVSVRKEVSFTFLTKSLSNFSDCRGGENRIASLNVSSGSEKKRKSATCGWRLIS